MESKKTWGGRRSNQTGRPRIPVVERKVFAGKVGIRISAESAALAQRLMLHFPDVPNVEALYELAMVKLAEHTDD